MSEEAVTQEVVVANIQFETTEDNLYVVEGQEPLTRRQFIQHLFMDHDLSRGDIAAMLGLRPNQVYQATVNMENSHHGVGRGSSRGSGKAEQARELALQGKTRPEIAKELDMSYGAVYAATKSVEVPSARTASEDVTLEVDGQQVTMSRPEAIRELAKQGLTRPQIKERLDVSYAVVWAATKNVDVVEARSNRVMVEMDDGRQLPRVDAIREYADSGLTRREIADKLALDYSVVWATTRDHPSYQKEESEEETEESLNQFTKAQLVAAAASLEVEIDSSLKKSEIVELLQEFTAEDIREALA